MRSTIELLTKLVMLFSIVLISTCSFLADNDNDNKNPPPSNDNIGTGTEVVVSNQMILPTGGEIVVSNPTAPIKDMKITIPPGSYGIARTFKLSYAPILSHKLGEYFNPISPLIKISNGGGYADSIMTIAIPVNVPTGEFAMAFAYDEKTGKLEGLPLIDFKNGTITIGTRHFSTSTISNSANLAPMQTGNAYMNLVISSVKESVLESKTIIASGFVPGIDDWEFTNWGSWIAPAGHCAGQAITALWYYSTQKLKGQPKLFGLLDNRADLWQDNPLGYKFASVVQEETFQSSAVTSVEVQSYLDPLTFRAFAASILVTGEPQLIVVLNSQGLGGHALIVHKVDYLGGILYLADPNYPGNIRFSDKVVTIRKIELVNDAFKPYPIGLNAGANEIMMDQIGYIGKTAMIDWGRLAQLWTELKNGTIGNNVFPESRCSLQVGSNPNWIPMNKDIIEIQNDTIKMSCWLDYKPGNGTDGWCDVQVFRKAQQIHARDSEPIFRTNLGLDTIGFYLTALVAQQETWVDFKYVVFDYRYLSIDPPQATGAKDKEIRFKALSKGTAPNQAKYVWDFGDGTDTVVVINDSTVGHTYKKDGNYRVKLKLYNNSTGQLYKEAEGQASISSEQTMSGTWNYSNVILYGSGITLKVTSTFEVKGNITYTDYDPTDPDPPTYPYFDYDINTLNSCKINCKVELLGSREYTYYDQDSSYTEFKYSEPIQVMLNDPKANWPDLIWTEGDFTYDINYGNPLTGTWTFKQYAQYLSLRIAYYIPYETRFYNKKGEFQGQNLENISGPHEVFGLGAHSAAPH